MAVREEDTSVFNPHVGASARVTLHSSESHRASEDRDPDHPEGRRTNMIRKLSE
jgi:hypothetical protein